MLTDSHFAIILPYIFYFQYKNFQLHSNKLCIKNISNYSKACMQIYTKEKFYVYRLMLRSKGEFFIALNLKELKSGVALKFSNHVLVLGISESLFFAAGIVVSIAAMVVVIFASFVVVCAFVVVVVTGNVVVVIPGLSPPKFSPLTATLQFLQFTI